MLQLAKYLEPFFNTSTLEKGTSISPQSVVLAKYLSLYGINLKPRPNDRNISTQQITTLLDDVVKGLAKRTQHFNATYHNIVGHNMLHTFGHLVAICRDMLDSARGALK